MDSIRDFKGASSGDIIIDEGIEKRLKTDNPDWYRHFNIGSDLEDLRGMDNTRQTGESGRANIVRALTHDGFIEEKDLNVRAVPTGGTEITYYIAVRLGYNEQITMEFPIDIA
jgi:hypothetical protein